MTTMLGVDGRAAGAGRVLRHPPGIRANRRRRGRRRRDHRLRRGDRELPLAVLRQLRQRQHVATDGRGRQVDLERRANPLHLRVERRRDDVHRPPRALERRRDVGALDGGRAAARRLSRAAESRALPLPRDSTRVPASTAVVGRGTALVWLRASRKSSVGRPVRTSSGRNALRRPLSAIAGGCEREVKVSGGDRPRQLVDAPSSTPLGSRLG
jgi:hypothetical protein